MEKVFILFADLENYAGINIICVSKNIDTIISAARDEIDGDIEFLNNDIENRTNSDIEDDIENLDIFINDYYEIENELKTNKRFSYFLIKEETVV